MKFLPYLTFSIIFTAFWIAINERFDLLTLSLGVVLSIVVIYISGKILGYNYVKAFFLSPFLFAKYIFFLLVSIFISGLNVTYHIFTGKIEPNFVEFTVDKRIRDPFLLSIIFASITLTPGTISVHSHKGRFLVLEMKRNKKSSPSESFEKRLLKLEKTSIRVGKKIT